MPLCWHIFFVIFEFPALIHGVYTEWITLSPVNERHNGLLRQYIPKGVSIEKYSPEEILFFADELNNRPRKRLGYRTPEELFEAFLDNLYAA